MQKITDPEITAANVAKIAAGQKVHYGETAKRGSNQHACGVKMEIGDLVAYAKSGGTADRKNVTCPDCNEIIQGIECGSVLYELETVIEQKKIEKKYYKKKGNAKISH